MAYRGLCQYRCDGCKVVESDDIDLPADNLRPVPPNDWLRVRTTKVHGDMEILAIHHFCPTCAPMIESYLKGAAVVAGGHA